MEPSLTAPLNKCHLLNPSGSPYIHSQRTLAPGARISNLGEDGRGHLFVGGTLSRGRLFNFFQIMA